MIRIALLAAFLLFANAAFAQSLSGGQLATLCTAVKADATANGYRTGGNTVALTQWLNAARTPATAAWNVATPKATSDEAPSYSSYDALAAGKRDSWVRFLDAASRDFTRAKVRNWVTDVWGAATAGSNSEAILLAATFSASNGQNALGGTTRTTGTVSALDLAWPREIPSRAADWLVVATNCS